MSQTPATNGPDHAFVRRTRMADKPLRFAVMVGSLRKGSYNASIARALPALAPEGVTIAPLGSVGEFPLYNADVEAEGFPPAVTAMADAIRAADGLVIVTPRVQLLRSR